MAAITARNNYPISPVHNAFAFRSVAEAFGVNRAPIYRAWIVGFR
jgi:hypothetical protein